VKANYWVSFYAVHHAVLPPAAIFHSYL
jgi:hypothetical protein